MSKLEALTKFLARAGEKTGSMVGKGIAHGASAIEKHPLAGAGMAFGAGGMLGHMAAQDDGGPDEDELMRLLEKHRSMQQDY